MGFEIINFPIETILRNNHRKDNRNGNEGITIEFDSFMANQEDNRNVYLIGKPNNNNFDGGIPKKA